MNISSLSVRRGITATMTFLIVVGFGFFSLGRLQLDLWPDVSFPTVLVLTTYTGASPEDMETLVTRPIEGAVSAAKGIKEVHSTSKQGASVVEARFEWGKDMDVAETDVRRRLDMIQGLLPEDVDKPLVFAFDPSMQPIVMLVVSGPYPLDELRRIAEQDIEPRIVRLPGVASAEIAGGLEREIRVELDPTKVAAFGLDVNQIIGAVYRENTQVPGGSVEQGTMEFSIQTIGRYRTVAEIGEVVVGAEATPTGPVPIRLKEVARIEDTFNESQRILEVEGQPAVWLLVRKQSGANTVLACRAVMEALPEISRDAAAADIKFQKIFNQADFINASLGNLSSTALIGAGITFLVLLFFLRNFRSSLIVTLSIPLSVITTFAIMYQQGMTLNVLSMAGLALAVGMLVDNSIVVLENIFRLREEGLRAWDAAIQGAKTVGMAVTASTLTTVVVFVPVLFVPGIAGVLFRDMAITICFSLAVSLLVALTFIPLASSRLLSWGKSDRAFKRALSRGKTFQRIYSLYDRSLRWALGHRWVVVLTVTGVVGATGALAVLVPTEFIAQDDQSMLFVSVEAPMGSNLQEANRTIAEVVEHIEKVVKPEERELIATDVGVGKGFVSIFSKGVHAGLVRVRLVPPGKRERSQMQLEQALRDEFKKLPGTKTTVAMPFNMMGSAGDIEIQIRGQNLETARAIGLELRDKLRESPDTADVTFSMDDQRPEVRVRFDRRKLAELGLSSAGATSAINAYFMGKLAGRYDEAGDEYDILVRFGREHRMDVDELAKMPLATPTGVAVPLGNVADIHLALGPVDITRLDQSRITRLTLYLRDSYVGADGKSHRKDLGGSIERAEELLKAYPWPKDFAYTIGGSAEDFLTSFRYLGLALLISVALVYMVMASQFESLRQPFIIMFTVPLAGIGVMLLFIVTRSNLDVSALVGIITLVGIVVNNGIVMVDTADQLRDQGHDKFEAIARAGSMRMRPIMMTALTTIFGMTPLALGIGEGAAGWEGLAKAVIGGLSVATFLTLFVVPVAYTFFAPKVRKVFRENAPPSTPSPMSTPPPSGPPPSEPIASGAGG